jgi:anti-sigma factor RsiW
VVLSWYQGVLVHARRTRAITESVALYLAVNAVVLGGGVAWGGLPGIYLGLAAVAAGVLAQAAWLRARASRHLRALDEAA